MVVVITATIVLALLCFTCGNVNVLSGIFAPFSVYFVLNGNLLYLSIPGLFLSLTGLLMFRILGWDANYKKPLFWKILQHIPSIAACVVLFIYYLMPLYFSGKEPIYSLIYTGVVALALCLITARLFITNPIYCLINMLYTKEQFVVTRDIRGTQAEKGYKSIAYYIYLRETEDGRFYINSFLSIYLNYFAKGKRVEFTLKRGCLGLLYCCNFPKIMQ